MKMRIIKVGKLARVLITNNDPQATGVMLTGVSLVSVLLLTLAYT